MAVGDTIAGQIRIVRVKTLGSRPLVAGPYASFECDHKADPENALYINPNPKSRLPIGAKDAKAPKAVFESGEVMEVQHLSSSLEEAGVYNADEFYVSGIEVDLNTNEKRTRTLTAVDTGLAANPTTSTTVWTVIFKYTVPDRRRFILAGSFMVAITEAA